MSKNNTILHVIDSMRMGGAEMLLSDTIQLLPDYQHILVTLYGGGELLDKIQSSLDVTYCLDIKSKYSWLQGVIKLHHIIRQHKPCLVHAHLQLAGLLTRWACPKHYPLFYSIHSPYSQDAFINNKFALPMEKLTARRHHHLIGVSELALQDYQQLVSDSGTGDVVYNVVGRRFFREVDPKLTVRQTGDPLRCISVGTLMPAKNYGYTLRAFQQLKNLPVTLDIYGAGAAGEELKEFVAQAEISNVRFMGQSEQIVNLLPQYDMYIISSSYEGFGIAPLEAMAAGLPVFASDIPVFREVLGDAAHFFGLSTEQSLADAIRDVISGKLLLEPLVKNGRARALHISHPDTYRQNLLNVYHKYSDL